MTNGDRPRAGIRELVIDSSFASLASRRAFTIVELLVVMAIILVLAGLILATSSYVQNKGARSRAEAEIAAMSAALENYKADNGVYPSDTSRRRPDAGEIQLELPGSEPQSLCMR